MAHSNEDLLSEMKIGEEERSSYSESSYDQDGELKGHVLVFINYEFPGTHLETLEKGKDFEKIKALFTKQKYEVECYFNRKRSQILQTVKEYASLANSGHLICFLSSHGNATSLSCCDPHDKDERKVKIIEILKAADTEERKENPKIFFIDACRGESPKNDIAVEDIPEPPGRRFVLGFSCLNLNYSFLGHNRSCGVYIETLIKVFMDGFRRKREEHAKVRDLQHFHKKVQRIFHKEPCKHSVQIPVLKSTVAGSVFLHHD